MSAWADVFTSISSVVPDLLFKNIHRHHLQFLCILRCPTMAKKERKKKNKHWKFIPVQSQTHRWGTEPSLLSSVLRALISVLRIYKLSATWRMNVNGSFTFWPRGDGRPWVWLSAPPSPGCGSRSAGSAPSPAAARKCNPLPRRRTPRCRSGGRPRRSPSSSGWQTGRRRECCGAAGSPRRRDPAGSPYTGSRPPGCSGGTWSGRMKALEEVDTVKDKWVCLIV